MRKIVSLLDAIKGFFGFDIAKVSALKSEYADVDDSVIDDCVRRAR